mmetsp:Transcript_28805/g.79381  ORF Transcript_28805/g.79381 Transcript_28805/m.79381 type:complete len:212 (-) Transcript_28805:441-1076(-)
MVPPSASPSLATRWPGKSTLARAPSSPSTPTSPARSGVSPAPTRIRPSELILGRFCPTTAPSKRRAAKSVRLASAPRAAAAESQQGAQGVARSRGTSKRRARCSASALPAPEAARGAGSTTSWGAAERSSAWTSADCSLNSIGRPTRRTPGPSTLSPRAPESPGAATSHTAMGSAANKRAGGAAADHKSWKCAQAPAVRLQAGARTTQGSR